MYQVESHLVQISSVEEGICIVVGFGIPLYTLSIISGMIFHCSGARCIKKNEHRPILPALQQVQLV